MDLHRGKTMDTTHGNQWENGSLPTGDPPTIKAVLCIRIWRIRMFLGLLDPDPLVRGRYGSVSFYHSKNSQKWENIYFYRFVTSLWIFILERTKIAGSGDGSNGDRLGSAGPDPYQNVTHPQHWNKEMPYLQQRERHPHHCPRWWSASSDRKTQEPVNITNSFIQLMS